VVKIKAFFSKLARRALGLTVILFLLSLAIVFFLRFVPPVASAFMVAEYCEGLFSSGYRTSIRYDWVDRQHISPHMALAAIAAEDQKFPDHFGFDFQSMVEALKEKEEGGSLRGASTISQQVSKNLFLWKGRSFIRKGLDAYFTVLIEILWPKQRAIPGTLLIVFFSCTLRG
jgi:monofunctional biosynthetic peptidoglycan transglycosylase